MGRTIHRANDSLLSTCPSYIDNTVYCFILSLFIDPLLCRGWLAVRYVSFVALLPTLLLVLLLAILVTIV